MVREEIGSFLCFLFAFLVVQNNLETQGCAHFIGGVVAKVIINYPRQPASSPIVAVAAASSRLSNDLQEMALNFTRPNRPESPRVYLIWTTLISDRGISYQRWRSHSNADASQSYRRRP